MPASFTWTVSTPIGFKNYDAALRLTFNVEKMSQLPCPVIGSVFVDVCPGNRFYIRNDDYGLAIDDEEESNISLAEQAVWDSYMSEGLGNKEWRDLVEETNYGHKISVTAEQLERLMQLSIECGRVASPLESCPGNPERFRVRFSGSSDDEPVYFSFDQDAFVDLVMPDETYCIQSVSPPSNDTDLCYAQAAFYRGKLPLKMYNVNLTGVDFSNDKLIDNWEFVLAFFDNMPTPDDLLSEFLVSGLCAIFENFTERMVYVAQQCDDKLTAAKIYFGVGRIDAVAQAVVDGTDFLEGSKDLLPELTMALSKDYPVSATILYRLLIDDILDRGIKDQYATAADCFSLMSDLAFRFDADPGRSDILMRHDEYVAEIKSRHGRKTSFWSRCSVPAFGGQGNRFWR